MKKKTITLAIAALICSELLTMQTLSATELSANVGATSNYLWRGLEQTQGKAAVFGGLDLTTESGFYAGTWASNADWADGMTYELDLYAGYSGTINNYFQYDLGFIYYAYPDETSGDADFSEVYASLSYEQLTIGIAVLAEGENGDFGDSLYVSADYSFSIANDSKLNFHLGSYSGDWLAEDSIDYGVSLSKSGFTFGLSQTDLDDDAGDLKVYLAYSVDITL